MADRLLDSGAARQCPENDCSPRRADIFVTYRKGGEEHIAGLIANPFFLPGGYDHTFPGEAARRAAFGFNFGMASGASFQTALGLALNNGYSFENIDRPISHHAAAPQNTGFTGSEQDSVDKARSIAIALSDPSRGKNQKKCDEALKKLSNGRISSLNSLVSQYATSGAGQNIFDGRKVSAGRYGTDNPGVPAFVLGVGTSNATTYLNSKFFNFTGLGADQAKAIVLLHEAVHQFGGLRDIDFDPRRKPDQEVGSRNITNAIIDNCFPVLREAFKGLQL